MLAKRAGYEGTFLGERSDSVTPAASEKILVLTARKTSRCNLAIELSVLYPPPRVPSILVF